MRKNESGGYETKKAERINVPSHEVCFVLNCVLPFPNLCWSPNPQHLTPWLWLSLESLKRGDWIEIRPLRWAVIPSDGYPFKEICAQRHQGYVNTKERPCEGTVRRQPRTGQGERPREKSDLLTPWSETASLQNCEKTWHHQGMQILHHKCSQIRFLGVDRSRVWGNR